MKKIIFFFDRFYYLLGSLYFGLIAIILTGLIIMKENNISAAYVSLLMITFGISIVLLGVHFVKKKFKDLKKMIILHEQILRDSQKEK